MINKNCVIFPFDKKNVPGKIITITSEINTF